jgi:hypothetical protein
MSTDILISYDTTGSMTVALTETRRRVRETVARLFSEIPDLRMALVAHGDYCDEPRAFFMLDFTTDVNALIHFVNSAPNTGGGDSDEFYELVFQRVQEFDWQADNRKMIFIADAEPHEVGYTYRSIRYHIDWKQEVRSLAEMGVNIYAVKALNNSSDAFYNDVARMTNGKKVNLNQFSDVIETILAISYHNVGTMLEEYREELQNKFRMNRNLATLFQQLGSSAHETWIPKEASGLEPVPPYRFQVLRVDHDTDIKSFVQRSGATFRKGRGFYQFTKPEVIQEMKEVVLVNRHSGDMFTGAEAREFIGLPFGERGKMRPRITETYDVYVQSTSANRKLIGGTKFLYENES